METKTGYQTEQAEPTLEQLMDWYNLVYQEIRPLDEELKRLKAAIVSRVKVMGETVEHGNVKATYRGGYTRVTWDGKALDGFAAAHPEILTFRKETTTSPSVSIKVLE